MSSLGSTRWPRRPRSLLAALAALLLLIWGTSADAPLGSGAGGAGVAGASQRDSSATPPSFSCEAMDQVPEDLQCQFIRKHCDLDGWIPFHELYYCYVAKAGPVAKYAYIAMLFATLPLFFLLLSDTAGSYFSPIMAHVSQSIPKMRPRFAGVTLMAMGNGAPDLSSNIDAIREGNVLLSAGALTGAAMFIQCIVAAEVIRIAGGVRCRGAMMRDVGIYLASVVMVTVVFATGVVNYGFIVASFVIYSVYVVWVFCGDEWHARGRPKPHLGRSLSALKESLSFRRRGGRGSASGDDSVNGAGGGGGGGDGLAMTWAALDEDEVRLLTGNGAAAVAIPPGATKPMSQMNLLSSPHLVDAKTYSQAVWVDLDLFDERSRHGWQGGRLPTHQPPAVASASAAAAAPAQHRRSRSDAVAPEQLDRRTQLPGSHPGTYQPPSLIDADDSVPASPAAATTAVAALTPAQQAAAFAAQQMHQQMQVSPRRASFAAPSPAPSAAATAAAGALLTDQWPSKLQAPAIEVHLPPHPPPSAAQPSTSPSAAAEAEEPLLALLPPDAQEDTPAPPPPPLSGPWERLKSELTMGDSLEWPKLDPVRRRFREVTFPLLLPVYLALRLTIPFVDPAAYDPRWLTASMVGSPLAILAYMAAYTLPALAAALAAGGAAAGAVWALTHGRRELPPLTLGTSFAFGPALFALLGFVMGVLWIDTLASEVVGSITLLSTLCHIPSDLAGLTLLAWGNSLNDYFGNAALTAQGHPSMAITACFASPLFNILISLSLGFLAHFAKNGVSSLSVSLTPEVLLGCVFLALYNVAVIAVGVLNKFYIPRSFHLFARAWYGLYFLMACGLALLLPAGRTSSSRL